MSNCPGQLLCVAGSLPSRANVTPSSRVSVTTSRAISRMRPLCILRHIIAIHPTPQRRRGARLR
eukprot:4620046-Alexandrium_andersonii.AAC.1